MMMLFRNAAEADPRTKVWLDGATISMAAGEALLVRPCTACAMVLLIMGVLVAPGGILMFAWQAMEELHCFLASAAA
jgi:hypothetical protein